MVQNGSTSAVSYTLDREELLRVCGLKLLTSDRDYVFFALQVDYPGKLNPAIDVNAFYNRWEMEDGNLYKALGDLRKEGIAVSISNHLNIKLS